MHIGVLTTGYPHPRSPVAGAFVRAMCAALARRGHTLTVLCAALPGDAPFGDPGVTVHPVAYAPASTFYRAGAPDNLRAAPFTAALGGADFTARLLFEARTTLSRCDALISHFALPCGLVGGLVRASRPHLIVVHGTDGWLLARCPSAFQRAVLEGATHVQFTHRALRDSLVVTNTSHTVRPMGVEWPEGAPDASQHPLRLLTVGRLVPVKRVHLAIALTEALSARGLSVELTIAGDGPSRGALEALARRASASVNFVGAVDRDARERWMLTSTMLVHTAGALPDGRTEGAPVVLLEAMACGLAVLCADAGGAREMVGDAGVVCAPGEWLAEATGMLEDPARRARMAVRGREIASGLRWESEAARIERVLAAPTGLQSR